MTSRLAVGRDECGQEFCVHMEEGQTLDDIREMYEECSFTHIESPIKDQGYYAAKYADPDYDPYYDRDEMQAEYDRMWS
jgi:hypothetical protein